MKHADMVPLMGKVVTVDEKLSRRSCFGGKEEWRRCSVKPWAGWIVGFAFKQDGRVEQNGEDWEGGSYFKETSRQLCVLVKPWPTMKAVPVPLDGFASGGVPVGPDNGGWRAVRAALLDTPAPKG